MLKKLIIMLILSVFAFGNTYVYNNLDKCILGVFVKKDSRNYTIYYKDENNKTKSVFLVNSKDVKVVKLPFVIKKMYCKEY